MICKEDNKGHNILERVKDDNKNYNIITGSKDDFKSFIKNEIDKEKPLIGFGIIGPPEACIITGYKNNGDTLLGWNFFQDMPEFAKDLEKDSCGYFIKNNWYENQDTIALLAIEEKSNEPEEKELLKEVLSYALSIMKTQKNGDYASGGYAYDQWAKALLNKNEFPQNPSLPMLFERLMCHTDALNMIGEGRYQGSKYFNEILDKYPDISDSLKQASKYLLEESRISLDLWALIGGMGMSEKQAFSLSKQEIREKSSKLILKAKEYYLKSIEFIEKALSDIDE